MKKQQVLYSSSTIVLSLFIILLSLYPFFENYKYNDHSRNWLNHDYGKNLLSSTEEYSVFMTEGGDNQVFSSLYFTYAEKLRQDLFPYDQKGNIFKRIYGDLRYVTADVLDTRSELVNRGLFTGQEPFYAEIRSLKAPYLVPYALGKPATYLTWKLPDQQKLGDFYYKSYGIMYKVQHISYAVVDYIDTIGSATTFEIQEYLEELLNREVSQIELSTWFKQLENNGYVSVRNGRVNYIKSYPKPFRNDPTHNFITRWKDIPNLEYYDYLSREIVISYSYDQINLYRDQLSDLQRLYNIEDSPQTKKELLETMEKLWTEIQEYTKVVQTVGKDSVATLHNLGLFYMLLQDELPFIKEDYFGEAIKLWESAVAHGPYSWNTYNLLLWAYIKQAMLDVENSDEWLERFEIEHRQLLKNMRHWKSLRKDITKTQMYKQSEPLVAVKDRFDDIAGEKFIANSKYIQAMLDGQQEFSLSIIQAYASQIANQLSFISSTSKGKAYIQIFEQLWKKYKSDSKFFNWYIEFILNLRGLSDSLPENFFSTVLRESRIYIPKQITENHLNLLINLFQISLISQNQAQIQEYKSLLLINAQKLLPADQYQSIKNQVDSLG